MKSRLAGVLVVTMLLAGCIDQSRVNDTCVWLDGVTGPLDLSTRGGREHLRADVEIANELMVRYGDAHVRHRPDLERPYRDSCMRAITGTIIARHRVTPSQIAAAERDRLWWADALFVFFPMAILTVVATDRVTQRVTRGFGSDERTIAAIMVGALALVIAVLSLGATNIWAFVFEGWRLRDGHVSNRAFFIPIVTHAWTCAGFAVALCIASAITRFRSTQPSRSWHAHYDALRPKRPRP